VTRRDMGWRSGGAVLMVAGFGLGHLPVFGEPSPAALAIAGFVMAIVGLVLVINGKRVAMSLRIERSRHRNLPLAIQARQRMRGGRR
jgi:hypothetical protein